MLIQLSLVLAFLSPSLTGGARAQTAGYGPRYLEGYHKVVDWIYDGEFYNGSPPGTPRPTEVSIEAGRFIVLDKDGGLLLDASYRIDENKSPPWIARIDITAVAVPKKLPPFSKVGDHAKGAFYADDTVAIFLLSESGLAPPVLGSDLSWERKGRKCLRIDLCRAHAKPASKPGPGKPGGKNQDDSGK